MLINNYFCTFADEIRETNQYMNKIIYFGGNFDFQYKDYSKDKLEKDYRAIILGGADRMLHSPKTETKTVEIYPGVDYVGPFYFYEEGTTASDIVNNEFRMVESSTDVVFLLDNVNSPGTISELIHAAYCKKEIHIFFIGLNHDDGEPENDVNSMHWYPMRMSQIISPDTVHMYECVNKEEATNKIINLLKSWNSKF